MLHLSNRYTWWPVSFFTANNVPFLLSKFARYMQSVQELRRAY